MELGIINAKFTFLNKISVEILQMLRSIQFPVLILNYHKLGTFGIFLELFLTVDCCSHEYF